MNKYKVLSHLWVGFVCIWMIGYVVSSVEERESLKGLLEEETEAFLRLCATQFELESQVEAMESEAEHLRSVISCMLQSIPELTQFPVMLSAYTPSADETDETPNQTATMEKPIPGETCAVSRDLKHLLGKTIHIKRSGTFKECGFYRVNDLMNARYTDAVDVCVADKETAFAIGRLYDIEITIIPIGENDD